MRIRAGRTGALCSLLTCAVLVSAAGATSIPIRTVPVSPVLAGLTHPDPHAAMAATGRVVAFEAAPPPPSPAGARAIVAHDVITKQNTLISAGVGGAPADGSSSDPSVSADGRTIAFASTATNLVSPPSPAGTTNVFVRMPSGQMLLASVGFGGQPANGSSYQPVISGNGRFVAFASTASNLVADDTNNVPDVFEYDLLTGKTLRISVANGSVQANGRSGSPSISGDGAAVSFTSGATNLVPHDINGVTDVFVRNPSRDITDRASVSTSGREQDKSVPAAFAQVSSLSPDGRLVAFDSNATDLVRGQDKRPRTDVFVRDLFKHTTSLVSLNNEGVQANNDSFAPSVSGDDRFIVFESFATNLTAGGGPRESIYVRDRLLHTTSVVNVAADGRAPGPETVPQLLQHPSISAAGTLVTFTSTAQLLTGDGSGLGRVLVRRLDAPVTKVTALAAGAHSSRPSFMLSADDPHATAFNCRIDRQAPFRCRRGRLRLPTQARGSHLLLVRAGGPGMLYDAHGVHKRFSVTGP